MKRIAWILGWAIPEIWFAPMAQAAAPTWEHHFFDATPSAVEQVSRSGEYDCLGGYSLGAHLLLSAKPALPAILLAPIFAFPQEAQSGGRVPHAQVRFLSRWLRRAPREALADFYARAGLPGLVPGALSSTDLERLHWGLVQLENLAVPPILPPQWTAWCGANDALLDAQRLKSLVPTVEIVAEGTHHPAALLRAWAQTADQS